MKFDNQTIDYAELDARDAPFTPGDYAATIMDETELCETKAGGAGVKIKLRLTRGPDGSEMSRQYTDTIGYSAAAAFRLKDVADAAGVARPAAISEEAANAFVASLRGQELIVRLAANSYTKDGVTVNNTKLAKYLPAVKAQVVAVGGRRGR